MDRRDHAPELSSGDPQFRSGDLHALKDPLEMEPHVHDREQSLRDHRQMPKALARESSRRVIGRVELQQRLVALIHTS